MARKPRLETAGFHHVVNHGIFRSDIFRHKKDKDEFLEILCNACQIYDVVVHDYCIMDNYYHLLLETKKENLSLMMRQLNSNYAIYFNKKEKRAGHLWQGRFKSWYIFNEEYLYPLFRYIEQIPILERHARRIGKYPYAFASTLLLRHAESIPCTAQSKLIQEFTANELVDFLSVRLSEDEQESLEKEKKRKIIVDNEKMTQEKVQTLQEHFAAVENKTQRNISIINAFKDGYTQNSIAIHLEVTASLVSQVIKKLKLL